jgi:peptide/nickel transport system permease protein
MARFIVHRLVSMVLVLFAISVLTFLIFQALPNAACSRAAATSA